MAYATTNPYTGETLKTFPDATDADVARALNQGDAAFRQWRTTPPSPNAWPYCRRRPTYCAPTAPNTPGY